MLRSPQFNGCAHSFLIEDIGTDACVLATSAMPDMFTMTGQLVADVGLILVGTHLNLELITFFD